MINTTLQTITNSSREYYGDYSHATGLYQSILRDMFASLSKKEQARYTKELEQMALVLVDRARQA
jgi:hypothetical protein